jgi:hypothetical protein
VIAQYVTAGGGTVDVAPGTDRVTANCRACSWSRESLDDISGRGVTDRPGATHTARFHAQKHAGKCLVKPQQGAVR